MEKSVQLDLKEKSRIVSLITYHMVDEFKKHIESKKKDYRDINTTVNCGYKVIKSVMMEVSFEQRTNELISRAGKPIKELRNTQSILKQEFID